MKKYLIVFFILAILISGFYTIFAQETQKIPSDFFIGKWGGVISGKIKHEEYNFPFDLELIGNPGKNTAYLKLNAVRIIDVDGGEALVPITVFDTQAPCAIYFKSNSQIFTLNFSQDLIKRISSDFNTWSIYQLALITGFKMEPINEKLFFLYSRENTLLWKGGDATGELHGIYVKKDILGKTVQINELIKTDKYTQRDIIVPNKGRIIVNPNSECKFSKDNLLELTMGELFTIVNKLKEEGEDFRVESPQAVLAPRGTQFITKVKKDGTTTLTVIDGEVEFLDKQMRKMVLVKKNQKSVVKPGGLPSEPVSIDSNMILRWWE